MNDNDMPNEMSASAADAGARIDSWISTKTGMTRSACVRLIENGSITVNGDVTGKNYRLCAGDTLELDYPEPVPDDAEPEDIPLDIVYEDNDIIVINKPSGMVVHPGAGNPNGTLVNALLFHCNGNLSGIGGVERPGIVHRIDKDTSGLLVVAKNDEAHLSLSEQLKVHTVSRVYYAICIGNITDDTGTVDLPLGRNPNDRKKMAVIRDASMHSRNAVTHYTVLERYDTGAVFGNRFSFVKCVLETGRTHQIRVHMAALGHPLLGDTLYGGDGVNFVKDHKNLIDGQCLHAGELMLIHPRTGEKMHFFCEMPENMNKILEILGNG